MRKWYQLRRVDSSKTEKNWQGRKWGINFDQKLVYTSCGRLLRTKLMCKYAYGFAVWRCYIQKVLPFYKITFTLFHFCPGNCVSTRENKQYRFYWKINFVERKSEDEVFPWNFKPLRKFILVEFKIDFCRYFQNPFFERMCYCTWQMWCNFWVVNLFLHEIQTSSDVSIFAS